MTQQSNPDHSNNSTDGTFLFIVIVIASIVVIYLNALYLNRAADKVLDSIHNLRFEEKINSARILTSLPGGPRMEIVAIGWGKSTVVVLGKDQSMTYDEFTGKNCKYEEATNENPYLSLICYNYKEATRYEPVMAKGSSQAKSSP